MFKLKNLPFTISLIVVISLVVGWGISMVLAWADPGAGCTPPNCNVAAPINVSGTAQFKTGIAGFSTSGYDPNYGLTVGNNATYGVKSDKPSWFGSSITVGGHINLGGTSDPSQDQGNNWLTWGYRADNNPYYAIRTQYKTYGSYTYSRLQLNWHTGIEIGAHPVYGGVRFFDNSPGVGANQIFSVGDGDSNVRVVNDLYVGAAGKWVSQLCRPDGTNCPAAAGESDTLQTVTNRGNVAYTDILFDVPGDAYIWFRDGSGIQIWNPEGTGNEVRLGAAWNKPGVYSNGNLYLGSEGAVIINDNNQENWGFDGDNFWSNGWGHIYTTSSNLHIDSYSGELYLNYYYNNWVNVGNRDTGYLFIGNTQLYDDNDWFRIYSGANNRIYTNSYLRVDNNIENNGDIYSTTGFGGWASAKLCRKDGTNCPAGGITAESDTLQTVTDRGNTTNNWLRIPFIRDYDNPGYYLDPDETSNLWTLCLRGVCRGDWPSGGITAESDTLQTVTNRGNTTTRDIRVGGGFLGESTIESWDYIYSQGDIKARGALYADGFISTQGGIRAGDSIEAGRNIAAGGRLIGLLTRNWCYWIRDTGYQICEDGDYMAGIDLTSDNKVKGVYCCGSSGGPVYPPGGPGDPLDPEPR